MADVQSQARQKGAFTDEEIAAATQEADKCGDRFTAEQLLGRPGASSQPANAYQVVWIPSARSQLEQSAASKGTASIAEPVELVNELLRQSPAQQGKELLGRARLAEAGSCQVLYRVDEPDKLVTVLGIKRSS